MYTTARGFCFPVKIHERADAGAVHECDLAHIDDELAIALIYIGGPFFRGILQQFVHHSLVRYLDDFDLSLCFSHSVSLLQAFFSIAGTPLILSASSARPR